MNEEIKEIFDIKELFEEWKRFLSWCYKNNDKTVEIHRDKLKWTMNYITNLQEKNQKLKELCDKYEEEHNSAFKLWTMKMEEMPDYEERMKLKQENEKLNKIIDELEKWLKEDEEKSATTWEMGRCFNMFDILNKLTELKKEVK